MFRIFRGSVTLLIRDRYVKYHVFDVSPVSLSLFFLDFSF